MDSKKGLYALSCIEDVVVVRAHIMNREIPIDDNGLATIFLSKAFALTESGAPPTQGFGTPTLEVPASDIPGLNELFPPAGGHVFTFARFLFRLKNAHWLML